MRVAAPHPALSGGRGASHGRGSLGKVTHAKAQPRREEPRLTLRLATLPLTRQRVTATAIVATVPVMSSLPDHGLDRAHESWPPDAATTPDRPRIPVVAR